MTRMYHPVYGYHVMLGSAAVEQAKAAGWVEDVPKPKEEPKAAEPVAEKRKPGRPRKTE